MFQLYFNHSINTTRGHARFARSPLAIRLGDSRIRLGDSGYGDVLGLGWNRNTHRTLYKVAHTNLTI